MSLKENLRSFMDLRGNRRRQQDQSGHPLPSSTRNALTVVVGEFCGTFMFLMLSFIGAQTALNTNEPGDGQAPLRGYSILLIAAAFGTAVTVNIWIFFRVTGGMFNPAVSHRDSIVTVSIKHELNRSKGYVGSHSRRCRQAITSPHGPRNSACGGHSGCSGCHGRSPGPPGCFQLAFERDERCSGTLPGNVPHFAARADSVLPGGREAPSHVPCPHRHWHLRLHSPHRRDQLHGHVDQSCAVIWPGSLYRLPRLPLDFLVGAFHGFIVGICRLQAPQVAGLPDCQSRSGCGGYRSGKQGRPEPYDCDE